VTSKSFPIGSLKQETVATCSYV